MFFEVQISGVTYIITLEKLEDWQITIYRQMDTHPPFVKGISSILFSEPYELKCQIQYS